MTEAFKFGEGYDTLYAITDGNVRAVLSMPRSLLIQKENMKGVMTWKNCTQENSILNIPEDKVYLENWRAKHQRI